MIFGTRQESLLNNGCVITSIAIAACQSFLHFRTLSRRLSFTQRLFGGVVDAHVVAIDIC